MTRETARSNRSIALCLALLVALCASAIAPQAAHADDLAATALVIKADDDAKSKPASTTSKHQNLTVFGVDVSSWQGAINWKTASKTAKFAIIRCGWGSNASYQDDSQWLNNVKGCQKYNVPFGVYLYSYATDTSSAKSEALHVIRCLKNAGLKPENVTFPIYLDIEDESAANLSTAQFTALFNAFKSTMNAAGWTKVGIYSSASWWEGRLSGISLPAKYRWVAHWNVDDPGKGFAKTHKAGCMLWQYTNNASVSGIAGRVDGDFVRNDSEFLNYGFLYRLYNPNTGEHLYTLSADERDNLVPLGWNYEGVAMKCVKSGGVKVYRLYNPYSGDHHYTTSVKERDWLSKDIGWNYEGVAWQAAKSGSPLYRLFNPYEQVGTHHYTMDKSERDYLVTLGWRYEGVAMYSAK